MEIIVQKFLGREIPHHYKTAAPFPSLSHFPSLPFLIHPCPALTSPPSPSNTHDWSLLNTHTLRLADLLLSFFSCFRWDERSASCDLGCGWSLVTLGFKYAGEGELPSLYLHIFAFFTAREQKNDLIKFFGQWKRKGGGGGGGGMIVFEGLEEKRGVRGSKKPEIRCQEVNVKVHLVM